MAVWGRGRARGSRSALWSRRRGALELQQGCACFGGAVAWTPWASQGLLPELLSPFHFASQCFIPSISMDKLFSEVL